MNTTKWVRNQWDRVGAWLCIGVGALALLLGWLGMSNTAYPAEQFPYMLSGGIVGVFLLGLGSMLWLSADLRDEWRKLDSIEDVLRDSRLGGGGSGTDRFTPGEATPEPEDGVPGDDLFQHYRDDVTAERPLVTSGARANSGTSAADGEWSRTRVSRKVTRPRASRNGGATRSAASKAKARPAVEES